LKNLIQNGLRNFTVTGTCFEYGMQEGILSEDLPSTPANAYAIAKDRLRVSLEDFIHNIKCSFKWVRLFYLHGEGQRANSLLSQLQSALDRNDEVFNMSPGDQLRDYLEVSEAARYIIRIALQENVTGIVNCCSGKPIMVKQLVTDYLKAQGRI
jgi:dTDP-6-deoxy-L-talose 4-dehydrogenase (NAD+)